MAGQSRRNDPMFYLNFTCCVNKIGVPVYPLIHWMLSELPLALRQLGVQGDSVVDIGCGPTLHNAASLAPHFHNIYLAEYQQGFREYLEKWLKKENVDFDWGPFFKIIGDSTGADAGRVEEMLRERVKAVWSCDINAPRAGLPRDSPAAFDAVFSACVIGVSTNDKDEYTSALKNVVSLIKPGGYFIYNDLIPNSMDESGTMEEEGLSLKEKEFRDHVEALGLKILYFDKKELDDRWSEVVQSSSGFLLIAKKGGT